MSVLDFERPPKARRSRVADTELVTDGAGVDDQVELAAKRVLAGRSLWEALEELQGVSLVELLALVEGLFFDPEKHPRWPANTPGGLGGQFMHTGQRFRLHGIEYDVAHVLPGKIYAHVATHGIASKPQTVEFTTAQLAQVERPEAEPIKGAKEDTLHMTATVLDPYVHAETHDPKIPVPEGSALSPEQWDTFGKIDQEWYSQLMERYGSWTAGAAQKKVDAALAAGDQASRQILESSYGSQFGSSTGFTISMHGLFHGLLSKVKGSSEVESARTKYEKARALQAEAASVLQWDLYNRTRAADIAIFHKHSAHSFFQKEIIEGKKPVFAGLSQTQFWRAQFFGNNTFATPMAIRHIVMATVSADVKKGHGFSGEQEVATADPFAADDRSLESSGMSEMQAKWLSGITSNGKSAGGAIVAMLKASMKDGGTSLPVLPVEPMIQMDGEGGKQWHTPPKEATEFATVGGKKVPVVDLPYQDVVDGHPVAKLMKDMVDSGEIQAGDYIEGMQGTRYLVVPDPSDPYLGLAYYKVTDTGTKVAGTEFKAPTGQDSTAYENHSLWTGGEEAYTFEGGGSKAWKKLAGHTDLPVQSVKQTGFYPEAWSIGGPEDVKFMKDFEVGEKFQVGSTAYEVTGALAGISKKIMNLSSGKSGKINGDTKLPKLVLKQGYTETGETHLDPSDFLHAGAPVELGSQLGHLPEFFQVGQTVWKVQKETSDGHVEAAQASGTKLGQLHTFGADQKVLVLQEKPPDWEPAQVGDTFAYEGAKATITKLLKDGTVQAKKQGGGVVKLNQNDAALAYLHRPAAWELGVKTKLKDMAVGQKFHGGTGVQQIRPYIVTEQKGKITMVRNLDTGESLPMSAAKSFAQLNLKQTAAVAPVEDHSQPPAPAAYDADAWQPGPSKLVKDLVPGEKFMAVTSQGQVPFEVNSATLGTAGGAGWHVTNLATGETKKVLNSYALPLQTLVPKTQPAPAEPAAAPELEAGWTPAHGLQGLVAGDQFMLEADKDDTTPTVWQIEEPPEGVSGAGKVYFTVVQSSDPSSLGHSPMPLLADWTAKLLVKKAPGPALPSQLMPGDVFEVSSGGVGADEHKTKYMIDKVGPLQGNKTGPGQHLDFHGVGGYDPTGSYSQDWTDAEIADAPTAGANVSWTLVSKAAPSGSGPGQITPSQAKVGDFFKFAQSGAVFKIAKVEQGQAHGLSVDTASGTVQPGEIALNENPGALSDQYGDLVGEPAPSLSGAGTFETFDVSGYNRVKNGVAGDLSSGQVFTLGDLDPGDVFEGTKGGHYQLKSFSKDMLSVNATVLDGPGIGKHTKFKASVKPAALLNPKAESHTPYADLLPGDPVKLGDLQLGDQFVAPLASDSLWQVVEPSGGVDEKNVTVANVSPGGELGYPTNQGSPPSLVVKLHAKKADTVDVPVQQVAEMKVDPDDLVEAPYTSYKWHKSGTKTYPKLSTMAEGVIFHDADGDHYKIKQAGATPIITDGTSLFKADGDWRGLVVDPADAPALTGPHGDVSPAVVDTHQEVEQQLASEAMTPNDATVDLAGLHLEIGDSLQTDSGTIYKITGKPEFGGFTVYDGASGDSTTLPNYLVPKAYAKAFAVDDLIQDDEPDLPSQVGTPEIPSVGSGGGGVDNVLPLSALAPGTHFTHDGGVFEVGPKSGTKSKVAVKIIVPSPGQVAQSSLKAGDTMTMSGHDVHPEKIGPAGTFDSVAAAPASSSDGSAEIGDYEVAGKGLMGDAPTGTQFVAGASSYAQGGVPNPNAPVYQITGPPTDEGTPMKNLTSGLTFSVGDMTAVVYLKPKGAGYQPYQPNSKMLSDLPEGARFHHPLFQDAEMEVLPWAQQSDEDPETYAKFLGSGDTLGLKDFVPDEVSLPVGTDENSAPAAFAGPAEGAGDQSLWSKQPEVGDEITFLSSPSGVASHGTVTAVKGGEVFAKVPGLGTQQNIPKEWITAVEPPSAFSGQDPAGFVVGDLVKSTFNGKTFEVTAWSKATKGSAPGVSMTLKDTETGVAGQGFYPTGKDSSLEYVGKAAGPAQAPAAPAGIYAEPTPDKLKGLKDFETGDVVMQAGWNSGIYRVMEKAPTEGYGMTKLQVIKPASESYEQPGAPKNMYGNPQFMLYPGGPMWKAGEYAKLVKPGNVTGKTVRVVGHDGSMLRVRYANGNEQTVEHTWLKSIKPTWSTKQKLAFQKVPVESLQPGDIFANVEGYYDGGTKYVVDETNGDGSVAAHMWGATASKTLQPGTLVEPLVGARSIAALPQPPAPEPAPFVVPPMDGAPKVGDKVIYDGVGAKAGGSVFYVAFTDDKGLTLASTPGGSAELAPSWNAWNKYGKLAPTESEPDVEPGTVKAGSLQSGTVFTVPGNVISAGGPEGEWIVTAMPDGEYQPWVYAKPLAGGNALPYGAEVDVKVVSTPGWNPNTAGLSVGDLQVGDRFADEGGEFEITKVAAGSETAYAKVLKPKDAANAIGVGHETPFQAALVPKEIAGPSWPPSEPSLAQKIQSGLDQVLKGKQPGTQIMAASDLAIGDQFNTGHDGSTFVVTDSEPTSGGHFLEFRPVGGDKLQSGVFGDVQVQGWTWAGDTPSAPLVGEKVPGEQVPGTSAIAVGDFVASKQGNVYEITEKYGPGNPTLTLKLAKNASGDLPDEGKEWTAEYSDANVQTWTWAKPPALAGQKLIKDLQVGDQFVAPGYEKSGITYQVTEKTGSYAKFDQVEPTQGEGGLHVFDAKGHGDGQLGDVPVVIKGHAETSAGAPGADVLSVYSPKFHKSGQHKTPKIGSLAPGTQFHDKTGKLYVVVGPGATGYVHYSNVPGPGGILKEYATSSESRVVVVGE